MYEKKLTITQFAECLLTSLRVSAKIRIGHNILRCIGLFEQYRDFANVQMHNLAGGMQKLYSL